MQSRITNIAFAVPDAMHALQALGAAEGKGDVPERTIGLVICARARSMAAASASTCIRAC